MPHTFVLARVYAFATLSLRSLTLAIRTYVPSGNYTISVNTIEQKCNFVIAFHRNFVYVYLNVHGRFFFLLQMDGNGIVLSVPFGK